LTLKVKSSCIEYFNLDATKKTLLVLGGSLGARRVNQLIERMEAFKTKCSGNMAMWEVIF
jgi:UDP-N-acetylglucosamine:LPS N-acetylglucosamine transferase